MFTYAVAPAAAAPSATLTPVPIPVPVDSGVVVGTEVENSLSLNRDFHVLRRLDDTLDLVGSGLVDIGDDLSSNLGQLGIFVLSTEVSGNSIEHSWY